MGIVAGWRGPGHTWDGGKSDDSQILMAIEALHAAPFPGLGPCYISKEPWLWLPYEPGNREPPRLTDAPPDPADARLWHFHRPDIGMSDPQTGSPICLVELDGAWHDTRPGRKATDRRDRDYRAHRIPFAAVSLAEYRDDPNDWLPAMLAATQKALNAMPVMPAVGAAEAALQ